MQTVQSVAALLLLATMSTANGYYLSGDGTSVSACNHITSAAECETAAAALSLSDTTATVTTDSVSFAPPYCFWEGSYTLGFNTGGNTRSVYDTMYNGICRSLPMVCSYVFVTPS